MTTYQYRTLELNEARTNVEQTLSEMGAHGWDLRMLLWLALASSIAGAEASAAVLISTYLFVSAFE